MAERDAQRIQLDFPQLVADVIRQLNLTGTVGLLEFSDQVTPVYIVAQRAGALDIVMAPVAFASAEINSGDVIDAAASTVVADTGALPAGTYDLQAHMAFNGLTSLAGTAYRLEHRNAANNATLATLLLIPVSGVHLALTTSLPLTGYVMGLNERLRMISGSQIMQGFLSGSIYVHLRPTP